MAVSIRAVLGIQHGLIVSLLLTCAFTGIAKDSSLSETLKKEVSHTRFRHAHLGVRVVALPSGRAVFDHQGGKLFRPASNAKLFTGALVIDRFDPKHRLQTSCYTDAKPNGAGLVQGNLIIYGRGDPSFSSRFHRGKLTTPFQAFAKTIHAAGIRRVTGNLIADESYFEVLPYGSGWTWDDLYRTYGAAVSALSVNDNIASIKIVPGLTVGAPCRVTLRPATVPFDVINRATTSAPGQKDQLYRHRTFLKNQMTFAGQLNRKSYGRNFDVTVARPAHWFGQILLRELKNVGVAVDGDIQVRNHHERILDPRRSSLIHIASVASPTLLEIIRVMMQDSQNLYSQLLLLQAGMKSPVPGQNTEDAAIADLDRFVAQIGISSEEVRMEEGSGLSRRTLVTPNAITKLLQHMSTHPRAREFASTLTMAGKNGTLANRMKNTSAVGNLHGKTGSLNGAKALSGYLTNRNGQKFAFSILLNNHTQSGESARLAIERIATKLADSHDRFPSTSR